ncbi:MAG: PAS domain-containing protein [Geminicoccaceae bacterium]
MAHPIQLILARQLAAHLNVPVVLVDPEGTLVFYNEAAEVIVGRRFEEAGEMPWEELSSVFDPVDDQGRHIPPADLPLMITLTKQRPTHKRFQIRALNGVARHIEVTSFPIVGLQGDVLGAAALFWEL